MVQYYYNYYYTGASNLVFFLCNWQYSSNPIGMGGVGCNINIVKENIFVRCSIFALCKNFFFHPIIFVSGHLRMG